MERRTAETPADVATSGASNRIFVGNLPWAVTEIDLYNFFAQSFSVLSTQIIREHKSGRSRGFGFVSFARISDADFVLGTGAVFNGRVLMVRPAQPPQPAHRTTDYGAAPHFPMQEAWLPQVPQLPRYPMAPVRLAVEAVSEAPSRSDDGFGTFSYSETSHGSVSANAISHDDNVKAGAELEGAYPIHPKSGNTSPQALTPAEDTPGPPRAGDERVNPMESSASCLTEARKSMRRARTDRTSPFAYASRSAAPPCWQPSCGPTSHPYESSTQPAAHARQNGSGSTSRSGVAYHTSRQSERFVGGRERRVECERPSHPAAWEASHRPFAPHPRANVSPSIDAVPAARQLTQGATPFPARLEFGAQAVLQQAQALADMFASLQVSPPGAGAPTGLTYYGQHPSTQVLVNVASQQLFHLPFMPSHPYAFHSMHMAPGEVLPMAIAYPAHFSPALTSYIAQTTHTSEPDSFQATHGETKSSPESLP